MELVIKDTGGLKQAAEALLAFAGDEKIFLFYGPMGAGKTTFISTLCRLLGSEDEAGSPTFSIVNEYAYDGGLIYHFDFYRLNSEIEALDFGIEEYLYSKEFCFLEWPEKIASLLPEHYVKVQIRPGTATERLFSFSKV